jgi:hypothetical protein
MLDMPLRQQAIPVDKSVGNRGNGLVFDFVANEALKEFDR